LAPKPPQLSPPGSNQHTTTFQKLLKTSKNFQNIPKHSKTFQKNPKKSKKCQCGKAPGCYFYSHNNALNRGKCCPFFPGPYF
jgi:hypothetical protein